MFTAQKGASTVIDMVQLTSTIEEDAQPEHPLGTEASHTSQAKEPLF